MTVARARASGGVGPTWDQRKNIRRKLLCSLHMGVVQIPTPGIGSAGCVDDGRMPRICRAGVCNRGRPVRLAGIVPHYAAYLRLAALHRAKLRSRVTVVRA